MSGINNPPAGGVVFATPAVLLAAAAAAGVATTAIRSDSTIAAFDLTVPATQALADAAATGSVAFSARRDHLHGMMAAATQDEMEAESLTTVPVTPGRARFAPSAVKLWCQIAADGTLSSPDYNVSSVTDTGVGDRTINFTNAFSSTVYAATGCVMDGTDRRTIQYGTLATGSVRFTIQLTLDGSLEDRVTGNIIIGDQ